jgi:hypothetical protein
VLADYHSLLLHHFGEEGVGTIKGNIGSTSAGRGNGRHDPEDHRDQPSAF